MTIGNVEPALTRALLIGLPETGKTTFVAALWHVVSNDEVEGALKLKARPEDSEHLDAIAQRWLRAEETLRTSRDHEQFPSMSLQAPSGESIAALTVPDLAGDRYKTILKNREWEPEFDASVRSSYGFLIFVHPGKIVSPDLIADVPSPRVDVADIGGTVGGATAVDDADREASSKTAHDRTTAHGAEAGEGSPALPAAAGPPDAAGDLAEDGASESLHGDPAKWATAPALVDLAQLLVGRNQNPDLRLTIIVSAWDFARDSVELVGDVWTDKASPARWLARELPLLYQYISGSPEKFEFRVYGVSAHGGDPDTDRAELLAHTEASHKIVVVGGDASEHDISEPLRWVARLVPG